MDPTLKITNVLSDPTRFSIYEYITNLHAEVTVMDIANQFSIHPNVARHHLSKLEDVGMLKSENMKSGKGGRPSRYYKLSDELIEINFPYRDYRLLSKIAIESMLSLGPIAAKALYDTGKQYGINIMENLLQKRKMKREELTFHDKMEIFNQTATMLGFHPEILVKEDGHKVYFQVYNCPFKEVASEYKTLTCNTHIAFIKGLLEGLFEHFELEFVQNMLDGCKSCTYHVNISN